MKPIDPAAGARFDPVAPVLLERFFKLARLLARPQVEPRLRAKFDPSDVVQMKDIQSNAGCVGVEPSH